MRKKKGNNAIWYFTGINADFIDSGLIMKDIMIHEHDFTHTNLIVTASWIIQCITCKICFCKLCGIVLNNFHDFKNHVCRVG